LIVKKKKNHYCRLDNVMDLDVSFHVLNSIRILHRVQACISYLPRLFSSANYEITARNNDFFFLSRRVILISSGEQRRVFNFCFIFNLLSFHKRVLRLHNHVLVHCFKGVRVYAY